jgi:hypothetical protein
MGPYHATSTDAVHLLWYLNRGDISQEQLQLVEKSAQRLGTVHGFASARGAEPAPNPWYQLGSNPLELISSHASSSRRDPVTAGAVNDVKSIITIYGHI